MTALEVLVSLRPETDGRIAVVKLAGTFISATEFRAWVERGVEPRGLEALDEKERARQRLFMQRCRDGGADESYGRILAHGHHTNWGFEDRRTFLLVSMDLTDSEVGKLVNRRVDYSALDAEAIRDAKDETKLFRSPHAEATLDDTEEVPA